MIGFVVLFSKNKTPMATARSTAWGREVIEEAIKLKGTYYLPVPLFATNDQIHRAYPALTEFLSRRKRMIQTGFCVIRSTKPIKNISDLVT